MWKAPRNEELESKWAIHWEQYHKVDEQLRDLKTQKKELENRETHLRLASATHVIECLNRDFGTSLKIDGIYWITQEMIDSKHPSKRNIKFPCWARLVYVHFSNYVQFRKLGDESKWISIQAELLTEIMAK